MDYPEIGLWNRVLDEFSRNQYMIYCISHDPISRKTEIGPAHAKENYQSRLNGKST